ncbi:hypothetical protein TRP66_03105 [Pseudomonas sp. JDS28PS106]|uniref:hypothetical protein n=1 Tax=Pseudomonas sp. JDS28PS106 TaxID=2497235 RepID=UPI002FD0F8D7
MAMNQQQRDERRRQKDARSGAEELRFKALSGEKRMIRELMEWTDDTEQASMTLACVRYVHSLGPDGARKAMDDLRALHKVVLSVDVERRLIAGSMLMIQQDAGDEVIIPQ